MYHAATSLAAAVERSARELEQRLATLNAQKNPLEKMKLAAFVLAALFEMQQHQAEFNKAVAAELLALGSRIAGAQPHG